MNEFELRNLKRVLEDLFELCKKGHYGLAMKKASLQLIPLIWEKVEEKMKAG